MSENKNLILTTGDCSDFDGFLALPIYYKLAMEKNMDVAFVMNYPAYLNLKYIDSKKIKNHQDESKSILINKEITSDKLHSQKEEKEKLEKEKKELENENKKDDKYAILEEQIKLKNAELEKNEFDKNQKEIETQTINNPGLGYKYNYYDLKQFRKLLSTSTQKGGGNEYIQEYSIYKKKIDILTIDILERYWLWCQEKYKSDISSNSNKPKLYYVNLSDAVNDINPFSIETIKIETQVYTNIRLESSVLKIISTSDTFFDIINNYDSIYMDMNGSMAWFAALNEKALRNEKKKEINDFVKKIKACFVMGGVLDDIKVNTMSAVPNVVNRFSSATMNQLYHPQGTKLFFDTIDSEKLYFITNNEINKNFSFTSTSKLNYTDFEKLVMDMGLIPNSQESGITKNFNEFYFTRESDRKLFDVIPALNMYLYVHNKIDENKKIVRNLYFNEMYGSTIISDAINATDISFNFIIDKLFDVITKDDLSKGIINEILTYNSETNKDDILNIINELKSLIRDKENNNIEIETNKQQTKTKLVGILKSSNSKFFGTGKKVYELTSVSKENYINLVTQVLLPSPSQSDLQPQPQPQPESQTGGFYRIYV